MQYEPMTLTFDPNSTLNRLPTLLMVAEVAKLLRMNPNTVYEAVARREIPGVVYVGRNIRFVRDIVVDWLRGKEAARVPERRTR